MMMSDTDDDIDAIVDDDENENVIDSFDDEIKGNVHFVYIQSNHLRKLEHEFAKGISEELPGWTSSSDILKTKKQSVNVTFFIYRRAHVMMSHGVADKNYLLRRDPLGGYEINKYRYVCVPGPRTKRRLLETPGITIPADSIRIVGWPRIDNLHAAAKLRQKDHLRFFRRTKVLWAPTHNGTSRKTKHPISSYPSLLPFEDRLRQLFDFEVSLHPRLRSGGKPTFDQLLDADIVIADRGSIVYEAWSLGKPVVFPSWLIGQGNRKVANGSAEQEIYRRKIGLHAESFDEMVRMLRWQRKPGKDVVAFMDDYLPKWTIGWSYKQIASVVRDALDANETILPKIGPPLENV
jgi:CDP-glycerol glycerophosphotransferase (TagB/SpsB family)